MIILKKKFGAMVLGDGDAIPIAKIWSGSLNIIITQGDLPNDVDVPLLEFRTRFVEANKSLLDVLDACMVVDSERYHSNENNDIHLDNRTIVLPTLDADVVFFEAVLEDFLPKLFNIPQNEYHDLKISININPV